jgi:adenylyltransferase/sulfurtransferase
VITILVPTALRPYTGNQARVQVVADTVGGAIDALLAAHSGLARHLRDDAGRLRSFVNVYLGEHDIRDLQREATPLSPGAEITIVPSIAGGEDDLPALSREEVERYSRHLILDEVGLEGQRRLKASSVLCVGTGGLGSPLLLYLAAAGVGRIGIVDFDLVDHSNLQRQVLHGTSSVGRPKVQSAKERILDINPNVRVDVYEEPLESHNALRILAPYDVVVDGTDNFPTRYLVNDACVILGKPNVYGSIFKFEGQASVFNYRGGPQYRDLYPEPPPPGLVPSCAEGGVLGILPGVIGTIQATETIKVLLGLGDTLSGRLLLYDALGMKFRELKLRKDPALVAPKELIDYHQFCGVPGRSHVEEAPAEGYRRISARELRARLDEGWKPYVLDVRRPPAVAVACLGFADRNCPHDQVDGIASDLPRDRDIVVHCKSGVRSLKAIEALKARGFVRLYNLDGGIAAWSADVDPSVPRY